MLRGNSRGEPWYVRQVTDSASLNTRDLRRRFDRAAAGFDGADFVHAATREGLIARLEPLMIEAKTVLDLGCATGAAGPLLRDRFPRARVIALDLSHAMLRQVPAPRRWFSRSARLQASAHQLPFGDASIDVVFANQLLPWIDDPGSVLREVARVLAPDGAFAFATLGPDSLRELDAAWRSVDEFRHVHRFPDMHDVGDALVRAGLRDPVLDVDRLVVRYDSVERLFADLTRMGGRNALRGRNPSLVGKRRFRAMVAALQQGDGIRFDLELVYGHCWGRTPGRTGADFSIDAASIPRRRS